jgi:hypothetical protein
MHCEINTERMLFEEQNSHRIPVDIWLAVWIKPGEPALQNLFRKNFNVETLSQVLYNDNSFVEG